MDTHVLTDEVDLQQVPESPLVIRARGSFFVGGESVEQSFVALGSRRQANRITINQMYVEYMVPQQAGSGWITGEIPVAPMQLLHLGAARGIAPRVIDCAFGASWNITAARDAAVASLPLSRGVRVIPTAATCLDSTQ